MHKCPSAICLFYPNPSEGQIKHALDGVECSVPGEIIGVKQLAQRHNCRRWLSLQVIRVQWKLNRQALQIKCFIFNFHSPPRGTDFYFLLIQFVLQSLHLGFYYEVVSPVLSLEKQLGGKAEDDFFEEFHWISAFWLPDLACCADAHEYDALPLTHTHYTLSLFHWTHTSRVAQAFNQYALLKLRFKLWPIFQSFSHEIWQRCKARVLNHPCGHAKHGLYEKSMWCLSLWIRLLFSWIPWFVDRKCWRFFWNWSFVMVVVVVTLVVLVCLCSLWAIPW